jgi:choline-sulfatase
MTGLHPHTAGVPGNLNPIPPLATGIPTTATHLRASGYQTVYHGKWHLGGDIHNYGFEIAEECSHDETTRLLASRFWKNRDWLDNDRPFFHVVSLLNPHDLYFYDPAEEVADFKRPWPNKNLDRTYPDPVQSCRVSWPEERWGSYFEFYRQMIERADADAGEMLHQLRCTGFFSNTWILFCSDHGDMSGEHNLPFKGPWMYDGVLRVPLVIIPPQDRFLGPVPPGTFATGIKAGRRNQLCSLLDIAPTILDLAGVTKPEAMRGESLLPVVRDESAADPHEYIFAAWHKPGVRAVRSRNWKYVAHENGDEELYDVANDPAECANLAGDKSRESTMRGLIGALSEHLHSLSDPFPLRRGEARCS